jgi:hypothetical protein
MYALQDAKPTPEVPKTKSIVIDGVNRGTVEPTLISDALRWHASITLTNPEEGISAGLAQGFGYTPDAAILDAVISARRGRDNFASALASLEQSLGVANQTSAELAVRRGERL